MDMTIGRPGRRWAGVNIETIRYQRWGLLVTPRKPISDVRRYSSEILTRLRFIRHAQEPVLRCGKLPSC